MQVFSVGIRGRFPPTVHLRRGAKLGVVLLGALAFPPFVQGHAAAATTITVNCTADSSALASALASANDGDTLAIQGTCNGTFEIAHSVMLAGSGGATLDGQAADTVLTVDSGKTVLVTDLTITGGFATSCCPGGENGGGIWNNGTLTLIDSTISGNATSFSGNGAGIYNPGALTLTNSTVRGNTNSFSGNGAGIFNRGTATITNSTVSGNTTSFGIGGGIYNAGATLTVTNSTITANTSGVGGGIDNSGTAKLTNSTISANTTRYGGDGGGIYNSGTATLTNSTISGNVASFWVGREDGGGIANVGTLTVESSTITANRAVSGGGVFAGLPATLVNTIVAGQTAGGNCSGTVSDGGYNLEDGTSCGLSTADHSLPGTNPLLDPAGLQSNDGPTQTVALLPGSPAIDAIPFGVSGCGTTITSDQRGVSRPQGPTCDIGAFELVVATLTVAIDIKPGDFPNSIASGSKGTIPVAILSAVGFNSSSQVDTTSLKFGRTGNESSLAFCGAPQDVNGDGLPDVVCHFTTQKTAFQTGDTQGVLTGKTVAGTPIRGSDSVAIVPPT